MSFSVAGANPSTPKPIKCPGDHKCCPPGRKCIKEKTATACRECFVEVKRLRRNHKIKMEAAEKKHKVETETLKKKHRVDNEKYQKLILIGEKRLSDQRDSLQKAAQKDKQAAFWNGLVWGVGSTLAVVLLGTAVVVVYYLVTNAGNTTKPLTVQYHQRLVVEGVYP